MGFCGTLFRRLFEAVIVFLIITFLPGLPPDIDFTAYSVTEPRELEGALAPNKKLDGAERLFEGEISSPECFAVANNTLYTAVRSGEIKKLVGDKLVTVADLSHKCDGYWDEQRCGRLLGITFNSLGMLYVVDAYYGMYRVNVNTGKILQLFATDKPIEGKFVKTANSVAVSKDGSVYWTASSCQTTLQNGALAALGDSSGRVFKFDPAKKTQTVLIDNLHFANGIVLSSKEDFIIIAETFRGRLHRYWLTGPMKGTSEVFIDGLPGLPDNLRPNHKGGFYCTLISPRYRSIPDTLDLLGPYPVVRKFLARLLCLIELPFELIQRNFPNVYTGQITYWINNFEMIMPLVPKGVIVLEFNESGEILESLQSSDNKVSGISDIEFVDQTYYLGSPHNNYIGRVKTRIPIHVKLSTPPPKKA